MSRASTLARMPNGSVPFALPLQTEQTAAFTATAAKRWPVNFTVNAQILMPPSGTQGDVIEFENYGSALVTFNFNGLKYYGNTGSIATNTKGVQSFRYTNAATGWIDA